MNLIRKGNIQDIDSIIAISKEYIDRESRKGRSSFLIRALERDVVEQHIDEFYVYIQNEEVAGYVWINNAYPSLRAEHTVFSESIDLNDCIYIKQVAVSSAYARQGIASQLYDFLKQQAPKKKQIACIAVEPMRNEASIHFHQKKGFREIGMLRLENYLGFHVYKALVFMLDQ